MPARMDIQQNNYEHPKLGPFQTERIAELEENRLRRLTGYTSPERVREVSEASTSTMRPWSVTPEIQTTAPFEDEVDIASRAYEMFNEVTSRKVDEVPLVVATDFGTTFSSVAFARHERHAQTNMIVNFPDDPMDQIGRPSREAPTESWYPNSTEMADLDLEAFRAELEATKVDDMYNMPDCEDSPPDSDIDDDRIDEDIPSASLAQRDYFWGYSVQAMIGADRNDINYTQLSRFKLLLDTSDNTQDIRNHLRSVLNTLRRRKLIEKDEDVIADYLTKLFLHTKQELLACHGITAKTPIEHVLCVPVVWESRALRRMQNAMKRAISDSKFGNMDTLFLVSEPEAAATFAVSKGLRINTGEAFVILDAGGGTVDATTYLTKSDHPLRLSKELVEPDGCVSGSSFLNEGFQKHLERRLKGEQDLERNGLTIKSIVESKMLEFEIRTKRRVDITKPMPLVRIRVDGLKNDVKKRFSDNHVLLNRNDFLEIFLPHLLRIEDLLRNQLTAAKHAGYQVQKVLLVGGFSGSPSLRNHLRNRLPDIARGSGHEHLTLLNTVDIGDPEVAVAHGGVLRALEKQEGPARITRCSFGFLRTEPHDATLYDAHVDARPTIDKLDGERYVRNTIDWLIKKGQELPFHEEFRIPVIHTFAITRRRFLCEEVLYVSDTCTESHYREAHPKNKGKAEVAGEIVADMGFLVSEGHVQPIIPENGIGKPHYKIEFELIMIVDGRNLRYEARWPIGEGGKVQCHNQISIAAAFRPGTK